MIDFMVVGLVLTALFGIFIYFRRRKKAGKTGCGCSCDGCTSKSCNEKITK
ncbi:MAG: FeoB-associated Cys-rich membrane protein [Eubacteriaceae bacterium]